MTKTDESIRSLQKKLADETDEASWAMLEPHYKRGALFWVAKELELSYVAACVALDQVTQVKLWLDNQSLVKVDESRTKEWEKDLHEKKFSFIITQPYVFIQTSV